jgi:hypothetical protein
MRPIGLTLKDVRVNPFTNRASGELMIVHLCTNCHRVSTNRIAGDDNTYSITSLLEESKKLDSITTNRLQSLSVTLLSENDKEIIRTILFGY